MPAGGGEGRHNGVQVLTRAAHIMRLLSEHPDGVTFTELANLVGLPRSTVHRIVGTLEEEGFVVTLPSGKLRLGPALIRLAVTSRRELRHEAAPYLEALSHELNETVDLAVLDGGEVLFIDQHTPRRRLRIVSEIGARFPVHCTANGKALLARLSDDEVRRMLPRRLEALTPNTITDRDQLLHELTTVRAHGYAIDDEEHRLGICAVGTAVSDVVGTTAAFTVVVPSARFHGSEQHIIAALLQMRTTIQGVLSGG
jgi:DNA-binding IclR family transcriptional regulator